MNSYKQKAVCICMQTAKDLKGVKVYENEECEAFVFGTRINHGD